MLVVIQCAGAKRANAGCLKARDGRLVSFVAHPDLAPRAGNRLYARPDGPSDYDGSWREVLVSYNERPGNNPLGLLPASELYENDIYRDLVKRYGSANTYILSAGWGLIKSSFLTPFYNITFSASAGKFARRRKGNLYRDFCMLPSDSDELIAFFGSKEYVPFFANLTRSVRCRRTVFYNSAQPPLAPGCVLEKFETRKRTNWQYECARALMRGDISAAYDAPSGVDDPSSG